MQHYCGIVESPRMSARMFSTLGAVGSHVGRQHLRSGRALLAGPLFAGKGLGTAA